MWQGLHTPHRPPHSRSFTGTLAPGPPPGRPTLRPTGGRAVVRCLRRRPGLLESGRRLPDAECVPYAHPPHAGSVGEQPDPVRDRHTPHRLTLTFTVHLHLAHTFTLTLGHVTVAAGAAGSPGRGGT
ncbi:hypothetical protein ACWDWS_27935 [Streptomyces sp. NPDC003328]